MKRIICLALSIVLVLSVIAISDNTVDAKRVKKSGYYYTYAQKKATSPYVSHVYDKMSLKKVVIKRKKITTYGSFDYGKKKYRWNKRIKNKKRTFKIAKRCKFYTGFGVPNGQRKVSKKSFMQDLKRLSKMSATGQCFIIHVKKGKAVEMMLGQG